MSFSSVSRIVFVALFGGLIFISCDDSESEPPKGFIEIEFDNVVGSRQLQLAGVGSTEYPYENAMDQAFNVTTLRYYISSVRFEGRNGEVFEDEVSVDATSSEGYFLVDESVSGSTLLVFDDIPQGSYNRVTFTVGVDSSGVVEGAAGGALDISNSMFWNWNAGYIAMKFEGQSPASLGGANGEIIQPDNPEGFAYHIGGWKNIEGLPFVYNNKTITLEFDGNATVTEENRPHIHVLVDINAMLSGGHTVDFSTDADIHRPLDGQDFANNIPSAFRYDHIHIESN